MPMPAACGRLPSSMSSGDVSLPPTVKNRRVVEPAGEQGVSAETPSQAPVGTPLSCLNPSPSNVEGIWVGSSERMASRS